MEQLVNFIIRPPRAEYEPDNDLLDRKFMLKGRWYQRKDIEVTNSRGNVLRCSHYMPLVIPDGKTLPCVIYCHGNSGSRVDASEAAIILLPSSITLFALDFSGSGLSEGEYVTLGWNEVIRFPHSLLSYYEKIVCDYKIKIFKHLYCIWSSATCNRLTVFSQKDDLKAVVDYLRAEGNVGCIGLWGRSMGAVTSVLYGAEDPSIAGMVLDSPFANLIDLMMELVDTYKIRLPKFTVKVAIHYMRKTVQKKANFDIANLNVSEVAKCNFVPALFGHATHDDFIQPHHSDRIYESYSGDKNIIKFDGDHNSPRPQFYFDSITIFFHNVLQPPTDAFDENPFSLGHEYYFDKNSWDMMNGIGFQDHDSRNLPSQGDSSDQVHVRRRMSRIEIPAGGDIQEQSMENDDEYIDGSSYMPMKRNHYDQCSIPLPESTSDGHLSGSSYDALVDFPYTIEDEERMLSEAIMLSLQDVKIGSATEDCTGNYQTGASQTVTSNDPTSMGSSCIDITAHDNPDSISMHSHSMSCSGSEFVSQTTVQQSASPSAPKDPLCDSMLSHCHAPAETLIQQNDKLASASCLHDRDTPARQQQSDLDQFANAELPPIKSP